MKSAVMFLSSLYLILASAFGFIFYLISIVGDTDSNANAGTIGDIVLVIVGLFALASVVSAIILTVTSVTELRKGNVAYLRRISALIKFGSIPFFVLNFILLFVLFTVVVGTTRGLGIITVPIPIIMTYFILMVTSFNSSMYFLSLNKSGRMNLKTLIITVCLQFIFVLDVIAYLYVHVRFPRKTVETLANGNPTL